MINWDEFEHIHVIKKLKQILGAWWNIDVVFTDERGHLKGFDRTKMHFFNQGTQLYLSRDAAVDNLAELVTKTIDELRLSENRYSIRKWDMTGYDVGIFPIMIENDFMGCVVATGFLKDQAPQRLQEIRERLAAFGGSNDVIENCLSKVKYVEGQDREHFVELVELVSQEVITLHVEITSRENRIKELNKELGSRYKYDNMIGKSKPMQSLYSLLDKIKGAETTVLIQGENGTGKELIAKAIHYNSDRKDKPFVIQNCSAFNDNLLESELFGHVKGSFTGAQKDKKGLFEIADKGTPT